MRGTWRPPPAAALPPRRAPPPARSSSSSSALPPPPGQTEFLASPPLPTVWPAPPYNRYRSPVNVRRSTIDAWERDTGAKEAAAAESEETATAAPARPSAAALAAYVPQWLRFVVVPEVVRFAWLEVGAALAPLVNALRRRWVLFAAALDASLATAGRPALAMALDRWHGRRGAWADVRAWAGAAVGRR